MRLVIFLLIILFSCNRESYKSKGLILGRDNIKCMCCGGVFIEIEGSKYRFYTFPENTDIKLNRNNFPIAVKLNWHKEIEQCLGDEIVIEKIVLE